MNVLHSLAGQRSHRPEDLPGDAGLHRAVVLFRSSPGTFQTPAMEAAPGFGGLQPAIFLDGGGGKSVLHLDDQHLVNTADGECYRPPRPVRHLPGRLNSVVQKVPQNRAQVHAPDIGALGKLHLALEPYAAAAAFQLMR